MNAAVKAIIRGAAAGFVVWGFGGFAWIAFDHREVVLSGFQIIRLLIGFIGLVISISLRPRVKSSEGVQSQKGNGN